MGRKLRVAVCTVVVSLVVVPMARADCGMTHAGDYLYGDSPTGAVYFIHAGVGFPFASPDDFGNFVGGAVGSGQYFKCWNSIAWGSGAPAATPADNTYFQQQGSSTIYKIVGGARFGVHSWQELIDLNGGSVPDYVVVPSQGLSRVSAGPPRDGTNIKEVYWGQRWRMVSGHKRGYSSWDSWLSWAWGFWGGADNVETLPAGDAGGIADGPAMPATACHLSGADGLKNLGGTIVYEHDGIDYPFTDPAVAGDFTGDWGLCANWIGGAPSGQGTPPDNTLLREFGSLTVWAAEGGAIFPVASQADLAALPYGGGPVVEVPQHGLMWISHTPRDGSLLREEYDPTVYLIGGGQRHGVPDQWTLQSLLDQGYVERVVPAGALAGIAVGAPVPAPPCPISPGTDTDVDQPLVEDGDTVSLQTAPTFGTNGYCSVTVSYRWTYAEDTSVNLGAGQQYTATEDDIGHTLELIGTGTASAPGHPSASLDSVSRRKPPVSFSAGFALNNPRMMTTTDPTNPYDWAKLQPAGGLGGKPTAVSSLVMPTKRSVPLRFDLWYYDPTVKHTATCTPAAPQADDAEACDAAKVDMIRQIRAKRGQYSPVLVTLREPTASPKGWSTAKAIVDDYLAWIKDLFATHKLGTADVNAFEVWNEPNCPHSKCGAGFEISPAAYAKVLNAVIPYLQTAPGHPYYTAAGSLSGEITSGDANGNYATNYLDGFLAALDPAAAPTFLSLHPYEPGGSQCLGPYDTGQSQGASMDHLPSVVASLARSKWPFTSRVWITEFAYNGFDYAPKAQPANICSESKQAALVGQVVRVIKATHAVKRIYWFELQDENDTTDDNGTIPFAKTGLLTACNNPQPLVDKDAAAAWRSEFVLPGPQAAPKACGT